MKGECNITFLAQPLGPWGGSKGQISLNFNYKDFKTNCVRVLTNIDIKHIKQSFQSVAWVMSQWLDLGVLGDQNFSMGICDSVPPTTRSSNL